METAPCCARCVTVRALLALGVATLLVSYAVGSVLELHGHAESLEGELVEREAALELERANLRAYREGGRPDGR